jgi:acyl-coenzyme A thioesterase PaaI-like protein
MPSPLPFAALLASRERDGSRVRFRIPPDWLQGRTTFGGLIAALAVQAMFDVAGEGDAPLPPLRALQTNFVGPVGEGEMVVEVSVLRAGKNTRQVQATVTKANGEDAQVAAVLLGTFGAARVSALAQRWPEQPPAVRDAEHSQPVPQVPGVSPAFLQHFDMRWAAGALPYTGRLEWDTQIHLRLLEPAGVPLELLAVMLADVPPTPVLGSMSQRAPASSVTWALELRPLPKLPAADALWRIDMATLAAADGYVNQRATLWAPGGRLAALAYQVVAVYA